VQAYLALAKDFIATVGFPIFVATLLLYRVESWHTENIRSMADLRLAILDRHLAVHCRHALGEQRRRKRRRKKP